MNFITTFLLWAALFCAVVFTVCVWMEQTIAGNELKWAYQDGGWKAVANLIKSECGLGPAVPRRGRVTIYRSS